MSEVQKAFLAVGASMIFGLALGIAVGYLLAWLRFRDQLRALAKAWSAWKWSVGAHQTNDRFCWCNPEIVQSCPQCEIYSKADCWRCGGRGVVEPYDDSLDVIVVHREEVRPTCKCGTGFKGEAVCPIHG